mgnify:FL=1
MSRKYKVRGSVDSTLTIPVDDRFYNWTAVASLFTDSTYSVAATATAGTIKVSGSIPGSAAPTSFDTSPISATDKAAYASAGLPIDQIVVTFTGIVDATHAIVTITATEG